jgi:UDP-N-acetylglucosamine diphosphorylase/glucosamine-1-phosphate N-acetyltransferase
MKAIEFLQDPESIAHLYPFTLTRSIQDIRIGIFTIREKWEKILKLSSAAEQKITSGYILKAGLLPDALLISEIKKLKHGMILVSESGEKLVVCIDQEFEKNANKKSLQQTSRIIKKVRLLEYPQQIFERNREEIIFDFELITKNRKSANIDKTNAVSNAKNIFIEKNATVKNCIINAEEGPVYIGKNALVMEGACLRGPISIGDGAVVKMGAQIYGATTIGKNCIVGGEIKNSVFFANSNKAHHGYLGDSVIGEWCNLGAGTSNSNLKNTAGNIELHLRGKKISAGFKCGVLMGDFSRTAINTSINTGTTIGVSANIFGNGLTPKHIPSFAWGFSNKPKYKLDKALTDAHRWKTLKGQELSQTEKELFKNIYKQIKSY